MGKTNDPSPLLFPDFHFSKDLCKWPQFLENCTNPLLLKQRVATSTNIISSYTNRVAAAFGSTTTTSLSMPPFCFGAFPGSITTSTPFATPTTTTQACFSFRAAPGLTAAREATSETTTSSAPAPFTFGACSGSPFGTTTQTVTTTAAAFSFVKTATTQSSGEPVAAAFGSTTTTFPGSMTTSTPFATPTTTTQACFSFRAAPGSTAAREFSTPETTTSSAPAPFSFGACSGSPFGTTTQTVTTTAAAFSFVKTATTQNSGEPGMGYINTKIPHQLGIEGPISNSVFIVNLDYSVNLKKLKNVFGLAGKIVRAKIKKDRDGKSRGKANVEYETPIDAVKAVSMFNNRSLYDRTMKVKVDGQPPVGLPSGLKSVGPSLHQLSQVTAMRMDSGDMEMSGMGNMRRGMDSVGSGMNRASVEMSRIGNSIMEMETGMLGQDKVHSDGNNNSPISFGDVQAHGSYREPNFNYRRPTSPPKNCNNMIVTKLRGGNRYAYP